jgi:hypothetical protein
MAELGNGSPLAPHRYDKNNSGQGNSRGFVESRHGRNPLAGGDGDEQHRLDSLARRAKEPALDQRLDAAPGFESAKGHGALA